mmetsp:Transcript_785/g.1017  ORF Transcript_785/g.1017 Transcript_785/m.1017 type:complete len:280 (-) Transcript_785:205-1044(-)
MSDKDKVEKDPADTVTDKVERGFEAINNIEKEASTSPQIEFLMNIDLSYSLNNTNEEQDGKPKEIEQVCFICKSSKTSIEGATLFNCARCKVAAYCSKQCQVKDWKSGHKYECEGYKRMGREMGFKHVNHKREAIANGVLSRIRFYSGPFAVHHMEKQGRGFLFLQSPCTLAEMSLMKPVATSGKKIEPDRGVLMHFLTLGEFDQDLCRDDFELAVFRDKLKKAVEAYDKMKEIIILSRFRCGHVALLKAPLVPDFKICQALAVDYEGRNAIQLQIDNM